MASVFTTQARFHVWLATTLMQRKKVTLPAGVWAFAVGAALAIPSLRAPTQPRVIKGYGAIESDDDLDWILREPPPTRSSSRTTEARCRASGTASASGWPTPRWPSPSPFELSSAVLSVESGDVPEGTDPTRYQKVGVHVVPFDWQGTLALDAAGGIIGGRWRGDPADGPDEATFLGGGPKLVADGGTSLDVQPYLDWPFIQLLAKASVDERPGLPVVHLDGGISLEDTR